MTQDLRKFLKCLNDAVCQGEDFYTCECADGFEGKSLELTDKLYEIVNKYNNKNISKKKDGSFITDFDIISDSILKKYLPLFFFASSQLNKAVLTPPI